MGGGSPLGMSTRLFLVVVYAMLVEHVGSERVEELLHGKKRWRDTIPAEEVAWEEVA